MAPKTAVPQWTLADRLRKALESGGVSHAEMADALMVHPNSIGNYLSGRTTPKLAFRRVWAELCDVPFEWLETGEGSSELPNASRRCTSRQAAFAA